jgi:hypothetical protein
MATAPISLDDYRNNLNPRTIAERLMREGFAQAAVHRAVAAILELQKPDLSMAELLVMTRRALLAASRGRLVRAR